MRNLCIDIGNTRIKVGQFEDDKISDQFYLTEKEWESELEAVATSRKIDHILISTVRNLDPIRLEKLKGKRDVLVANPTMPFPIDINYETPKTLGVDRIFGAIGAHIRYPDSPTLSIDAGTCITYDIVTPERGFIGGAISPGVRMRLKAMHTFTGQLPMLEFSDQPVTFGTSTASSMQMGAKEGAINEMSGMIQSFQKEFRELKVLITGGDAFLFEQVVENTIFAAPNLVLEGMNAVLLFNKH